MNLDANLLNKFAETINSEEPVVNTTTEFFGKAKELDADGFWIVIPDAISSEELSEENYVRCSYEGVMVHADNRVKYKIENGEAAIIANLSEPNGSGIAIVHVESNEMGYSNDNPSAGNAGHLLYTLGASSYIGSSDVASLLNDGYTIIGLASIYLKVRRAEATADPFNILWEDADAIANLGPTTSYLGNYFSPGESPRGIDVVYFMGGAAASWKFIVCGDLMMVKTSDLKILPQPN